MPDVVTFGLFVLTFIGLYVAEQSRRTRERLEAIEALLGRMSDSGEQQVGLLDTIALNTKPERSEERI